MRLEYDQICTWNSEVEPGQVYLYAEGNLKCKVKVVQISLDTEGLHLELQVGALPPQSPLVKGEKFTASALRTILGTSSWWHLHDPYLVHFPVENCLKNNTLRLIDPYSYSSKKGLGRDLRG